VGEIKSLAVDPVFWIVSLPLVALFVLSMARIGRPYRKDPPPSSTRSRSMTADLSALIARLEAAEEVTRDLAVEVAAFMYADTEAFKGAVNYDPELWVERNQSPLCSLDAALALAARVLDGWLWDVTTITTAVGGLRKPLASVVRPDQPEGEEIKTWGYGSTPALALCIAILRAKQGEGE